MPTYNFSTITAAQALAITAADTLLLDLAGPQGTRVLYTAADQITLVAGGQSIVFGLGVAAATKSFSGGGSLFIGGTGDDQKSLDVGPDGLFGGTGTDSLAGGAGDDLLQGNQGGDSLSGGAGYDVVYGGQDNDFIDVGADGQSAGFGHGNRGDDIVLGSAGGSETLLGGQGNDLINATGYTGTFIGAGVEILTPTGGRTGAIGVASGGDFLNGNLGDDTIFGGDGADRIFGEGGEDYLADAGGVTTLIDGGEGNDGIVAANLVGVTTVLGGLGDDRICVIGFGVVDAGAGDDQVGFFTGDPNDPGAYVLQLGDGNDVCIGVGEFSTPLDQVTIDGGAGDDLINAADGEDSITGGAGGDTIDSWAGADTVAGGAGSDQFQYFGDETTTVLDQVDLIVDWSSEDRFYFEPLGFPAVGAGTAANYAEGSAASYDGALSFASSRIAGGVVDYVAVQVGGDVFVFADSQDDDGAADSAVCLVGRSLDDIGFSNFDGVSRLLPDFS